MIKNNHKEEAKAIGSDSYELQNFMSLPANANIDDQVSALERDQKWQEDHNNEISSRIDALIFAIRGY